MNSPSRSHIAGQHMLGGLFRNRGNDLQVADDLLRGSLRLDNHPVTQINIKDPDWLSDPFKDNNWQFSFHSLRWVDVLRRTYESTKDSKYLDAYITVAKSWHRNHIESPQGKMSRFAWYDMGAGLRVLILAGVMFTVGDEDWLRDCIHEHGIRMSPESFGHQVGNHIIHIHNGLMTAGHIMQNSSWKDMATYRLKKLLVENVNLEGVADDGAIQYQINNYNWYKEALDHAKAAGIEHGDDFDRVMLMPDFLVHCYQTNRSLIQFGDSDRTALPKFNTPEISYIHSKGDLGEEPEELYKCYSEAGYAFGRTNWNVDDMSKTMHYSLRFGPPQSAHTHAHEDGGSITVNFAGTELHPEGGRFRYDTQPMSVYFKSQNTHSTLLIEGERFDPDAPTRLVKSESTVESEITIVKRVEKRGSTWSRSLFHDRTQRILTVTDYVTPFEETNVMQLWQLPQGAIVRIVENKALIFLRGRHLATLTTGSTGSIYYEVVEGRRSKEHIEGWRSVKYGECFAAPVLKIGSRVSAGLMSTVISPQFADLNDPFVSVVADPSRSQLMVTTARDGDVSSMRYWSSEDSLFSSSLRNGAVR